MKIKRFIIILCSGDLHQRL